MGIDDKIFSNGEISKTLLKFAVPSIISLFVSELYNMVDTVFCGRYIGSDAIAALTIVFPIQRFLISLGLLSAVGASTYVSRSLGEKNPFEIRKTIINSFIIALSMMLTIPLIIFIFKMPLLHRLGASSATYHIADEYLVIILFGTVFQCLGTVASYIMTALGNTRITLYANSIGAVLNIILNYVLVANYGLGIRGSAASTVISQIASFIYVLYNFKNIVKKFRINFSLSSIITAFDKNIIKGIIAVGFSTFIIEVSDAIVSVFLNSLLSIKGGDTAIITVGVVTRISMFMFISIIGISSAMQPIAAYNYGAERFGKVKQTVMTSIKYSTMISAILGVILSLSANKIIGFFLKDKEILYLTVRALKICISVLPLVGVYYIVIYYYQAVGEAKKGFILSLFRQLIVFIPLAIVFGQIFGTIGVWIAYPVSDITSTIFSLYLLRNALKSKNSIPASKSKSAFEPENLAMYN